MNGKKQSAPLAYTATNKTIHLWAIGAMADYMMFVPFQGLILPVFTTGFALSPKLVGIALALPRIFDAIVDPIMGHLSDNANTRWGRRRPFLFVSTILGAILVVAMWWPPRHGSEIRQFVFLLGLSLALYILWGVYTMTHVAFGYELSDDYHLRTKVASVRGFYTSLAAVAGGWLYWLAQHPFFGDEIRGIRWVGFGMGIVALITGLIPVIFCRERFEHAPKKHVNLIHAIKTTLEVRPFIFVLLLRIAQTLGITLYGQMAFFISAYTVCGGDKKLASSLSGYTGYAGFLASFLMVPFAAVISKKVGKKRGLVLGFAAAFLGAVTVPVFAQPGHPYLFLVHMILFGMANVPLAIFMASIMPDICDIDELNSGERREGLFSAVMSFVSKIENSICILLGGYLVAWSGFDASLAQKSIMQPQHVIDKLRLMAFSLKILFAGMAFAIAFFVPISHQLMEEVRARLDARRGIPIPVEGD